MVNMKQVFLILMSVGISVTEYTLKDGEVGKYRYYLKDYQKYDVCCYCPKEAVLYQEYIEIFQLTECEHNDAETDPFGKTAYPYCSCQEERGLTPYFIGCTLPKSKDVDWDCDNGFLFPNVTVYTTCEPRCKDETKVLDRQGTEPYRCNEEKKWENNPSSVVCKTRETGPDFQVLKVVVILSCLFGVILFIIIIVCWRKRWYAVCLTARGKFSSRSSEDSSNSIIGSSSADSTVTSSDSPCNSKTECTYICLSETCPQAVENESTGTSETSFSFTQNGSTNRDQNEEKSIGNKNKSCYVHTSCDHNSNSDSKEPEVVNTISNSDEIQREERTPLLRSTNDQNQLVKVSGSPEYRDGVFYYNQLLGQDVVIATKVKIDTKSDFIIDRQCAVRDEKCVFVFKIKNVGKQHEGIYNWKLNDKSKMVEGSFYIVVHDSERHAPVGHENNSSLSYQNLTPESLLTIEEPRLEVNGPAASSNQNLATVCRPSEACSLEGQNISLMMSGSQLTLESSAVSSLSEQAQENQESHKHMKCYNCNVKLSEAVEDYSASKNLEDICIMLDPKTKNECQCWIGFLKFYQHELKKQSFHIKSIGYHKKGNPDDGHMKYILNSILPPHDFTVGHIVYFFSQRESRRTDVLSRIKEFHTNCPFCDKYLNSSKGCSVS